MSRWVVVVLVLFVLLSRMVLVWMLCGGWLMKMMGVVLLSFLVIYVWLVLWLVGMSRSVLMWCCSRVRISLCLCLGFFL